MLRQKQLRYGTRCAELEDRWTEEAAAAGRATIETEGATRKDEFIAAHTQEFLESIRGKRLAKEARQRNEEEWGSANVEAVVEATGDQHLQELLEEKARLAKEKLTRENRATELLAEFEGLGLDLEKLERNDTLMLYLGELVTEMHDEKYYDGGWQQTRQVSKTGVIYNRKITLVAQGDGKLMVRYDSLGQSEDVWAKMSALEGGTVIALGNRIEDNGRASREPFLAADMLLHYDPDPSTLETFIGLPVGVANITVNGVSARTLDFSKPL